MIVNIPRKIWTKYCKKIKTRQKIDSPFLSRQQTLSWKNWQALQKPKKLQSHKNPNSIFEFAPLSKKSKKMTCTRFFVWQEIVHFYSNRKRDNFLTRLRKASLDFIQKLFFGPKRKKSDAAASVNRAGIFFLPAKFILSLEWTWRRSN